MSIASALQCKITICLMNFFTVLYANPSFAGEVITVRGMSVASSIDDIERVMGPCSDNREGDDFYYCGSSDFNVFKLNEDGQITVLYVACEIFNGCNYSVEQLANALTDKLEAVRDFEIKDTGFMGEIATLRGEAGDTLEILEMDAGPLLTFRVGTSRNTLLLD